MATTRDVPLTLSVETIGTEGVKRLKDDVAALGKQGADAAPEFAALGNEIEALGKQAGLTGMMKALTEEVDRLTAAQTLTATRAKEATAALRETESATDLLAQKEREATQASKAAADALFAKKQELKLLIAAGEAAYKGEGSFTEAVRTQRQEIINGSTALRALNQAKADARAETAAAVRVENELAAAATNAARQDAQAQAALGKKAELLRDNVSELRKYGLEVETVTAAEFGLSASYQALVRNINATRDALNAKIEAEKAAVREEERLMAIQAATQRELRAAAKLAADEILSDYAKMEAAQAKMAAQTKAAGEALNNAFSTVGVRSVASIRAEIQTVNEALATVIAKGGLTGAELRNAMASAQGQVATLEREIRGLTGELTLADKAANLFQTSMGQFTAGNLVAQGVSAIAMKVVDMGRAFVDAMVQGQQLSRGLNAIFKDSATTQAQIDFLRKSSSEAGVSFSGLSTEFVKFSAAMKSANVPLEQSNALFMAVTRASASLGLGAEATAGSLNALGQMASKGVVSLEELRGQLGDRLPGAIGLTAKGFGITEAQLIKLIESGNLATRDFIVPFTKSLSELAGETDGLIPAWERFKGLLAQTSQTAGEAGGISILTGTLKVLGGTFGAIVLGLSALGEGLALVGSLVVAFYARLRGDAGAWDFFNAQSQKAVDRLAANAAAFNNFLDPAAAATTATKEMGAAVALTAEQSAKLDAAIKLSTGTHAVSKVATDLAADATLNAAGNIVKFTVAADTLIAKQALITEGMQRSAKAAKDQGDEMITLAKLSGDAAQLRAAEAASAELQATALQKVAESQKAEVDLLILERQRKIASAEATGIQGSALADLTAKIDAKLAKGIPELEQMRHAADAARAEAEARKLASEALKDNSALVDGYAKQMADAASKVEALKNAEAAGVEVKALLRTAQEDLAKATFLYNDSIKDNIAKIDQKSKMEQAAAQASIALAQANQSNATSMAAYFKALGDNTTAQYYEIQAKQAAIKVIQLQMEMTRAMNAVRVLEIEATLKTLTGTDDLTRAKVNALQVELEMIKVKNISNDAMRNQVTLIEAEITALRNGTSVRSGSTGTINSDTSARERNANAIEKQNAALEKQKRLTSDGFERNADGSAKGTFSSTTANGDLYALQQKQNAGSLGAGDLAAAQAAFQKAQDNQQWLNNFRQQNPGGVSFDAVMSTERALNSAADILNRVQGLQQTSNNQTGTGGSTTHKVDINLNGANTQISTASAGDSTALANLLKQLGIASQRAA